MDNDKAGKITDVSNSVISHRSYQLSGGDE